MTANPPQLKPCPLCKGNVNHHTDTGFHYGSMGGYKHKSEDFTCDSCGLKLSVRGDEITKEQAFEQWNNRAVEPLAALREVVERMKERAHPNAGARNTHNAALDAVIAEIDKMMGA